MKEPISRAIRVIKIIYTPLSFGFIFYFCWINRSLIQNILSLSNDVYLLYSVAAWIALHLLAPLAPRVVLGTGEGSLTYSGFLSIHIQQIPARYLPGGIWHTVGRMTAYHLAGISKKMVALYAFIETVSPCIVTLLLGSFFLWISGAAGGHRIYFAWIALLQFGVVLFIPLASKLIRPGQFHGGSLLQYGLFLLLSAGFWMVATLSFWFYYHAFFFTSGSQNVAGPLRIIGSYLFSWGVGYLAFFAPQGIGVFEVVAGKLIQLPMEIGGAVVFMAGFRLIALSADLFVWGVHRSLRILCREGSDPDGRRSRGR